MAGPFFHHFFQAEVRLEERVSLCDRLQSPVGSDVAGKRMTDSLLPISCWLGVVIVQQKWGRKWGGGRSQERTRKCSLHAESGWFTGNELPSWDLSGWGSFCIARFSFPLVSREDQREPTYFPGLDLIHVKRQEELGDPLQVDAVLSQMQVPHPVLKYNHSHLHDTFLFMAWWNM